MVALNENFDRATPLIHVRARTPKGVFEHLNLGLMVKSFTYEDNERKADKLEMVIDNWQLENFDDPVFQKGTIIEVAWGYESQAAPTRTMQIRSVKGFSDLTIEAHGLELNLNKKVECRVYENMTRTQVALEVAERAGFRAGSQVVFDQAHVEETDVVHAQIVQARKTDAQFLTKLARQEGFVWYIDWDGFHFHQRDVSQRPSKIYTYYNDTGESGSNAGEIISISVENDITAKPGKVKVVGRDPKKRENIEEEASNDTEAKEPVAARYTPFVSPDAVGFVETREQQEKAKSGVAVQEETVTTAQETKDAAKRVAKGKFRETRQTTVKLNMTVIGDPLLLAKSVYELRGVGKRLSQKYYVRKVVHRIASGYTCEIESISDGTGKYAKRSGLMNADVIQVGANTKGKKGPNAKESAKKKQSANKPPATEPLELTPTETINLALSGRDPRPERKIREAGAGTELFAIRRAQAGKSTMSDLVGTLDPQTVRAALKMQEDQTGSTYSYSPPAPLPGNLQPSQDAVLEALSQDDSGEGTITIGAPSTEDGGGGGDSETDTDSGAGEGDA